MSRPPLTRLSIRGAAPVTIRVLALAYVVLICLWYGLRLVSRDTIGLVAAGNAFALYLFVPLVVFVVLLVVTRQCRILAFLTLPLLLFLSLYGAHFLPRNPPADASQPTLRVMTFNVNGNTGQHQLAADLIASEAADVVFIQELSPHHSSSITSELGTQYPYRQFEPLPGRRGIGVLSRFPLQDSGWMQLGRDRNAGQHVELEWQGQTIDLFNVHLESTSTGEDVAASFRERETQVQELLDWVEQSDGPALVAGDFNLTDTTEAYAMLTRELQDAHRAAGWGLGLTFPANPDLQRGVIASVLQSASGVREERMHKALRFVPMFPYPLLRIDYLFSARALRATNAYAAPWDGQSDHRAVVAEFQFEPAE